MNSKSRLLLKYEMWEKEALWILSSSAVTFIFYAVEFSLIHSTFLSSGASLTVPILTRRSSPGCCSTSPPASFLPTRQFFSVRRKGGCFVSFLWAALFSWSCQPLKGSPLCWQNLHFVTRLKGNVSVWIHRGVRTVFILSLYSSRVSHS